MSVAYTDTTFVIRIKSRTPYQHRQYDSTLLPRLNVKSQRCARLQEVWLAASARRRMDTNRQRSKMFCGHCSQYLSKSTYYRHRQAFYDKKRREWLKEKPVSSNSSSESELTCSSNEDESPSLTHSLSIGCEDAGMIILCTCYWHT